MYMTRIALRSQEQDHANTNTTGNASHGPTYAQFLNPPPNFFAQIVEAGVSPCSFFPRLTSAVTVVNRTVACRRFVSCGVTTTSWCISDSYFQRTTLATMCSRRTCARTFTETYNIQCFSYGAGIGNCHAHNSASNILTPCGQQGQFCQQQPGEYCEDGTGHRWYAAEFRHVATQTTKSLKARERFTKPTKHPQPSPSPQLHP